MITLVGNGKTYCARVGDTLRVALRGTGSSQWLRPLVSGDAVVPVPGAATDEGVTDASFVAIRPGRVIVTSVRPPCRVAVPSAKDELEPGFPLPKVYPPGSAHQGAASAPWSSCGGRRRDQPRSPAPAVMPP